MDMLTTLGPLLLGLGAWALGIAALAGRRTGLCAPSFGCCAASLFLVVLYCGVQLREGDFTAIEDTWDAFSLCAAALLSGTLLLNFAAVWRARRGHASGHTGRQEER